MYNVGVVKYKKPLESLQKAIELAGGFGKIGADTKIVLKPNLVVWHEGVNFPKYAVLTTSRMIEDTIKLLIDCGAKDISIVEGSVDLGKKTKDKESIIALAAKGLGYDVLKSRYGIKVIDALEGSFQKVKIDDVKLSVSTDIMEADCVINMPVLKTHSQAMVSLGIKNLKGVINIASRKICHNKNQNINLNYHLTKLMEMIPISFSIIDGIYTNDRGPSYNGRARRSNIIVAAKDMLAGDLVGATVLGIDPATIPYLSDAATQNNRPVDLSDITVKGDVDIKNELKPHIWEYEHEDGADMPDWMIRSGIKGISMPKQDLTICTYCAFLFNKLVMGLLMAKNKKQGYDDVEILDGKIQTPTAGHKHTILFGQCQVKLNKDNPLINHCVKVPGCPANDEDLYKAFAEVGIELPDDFPEWVEKSPELVHGQKYKNKPEFDPSFYTIK